MDVNIPSRENIEILYHFNPAFFFSFSWSYLSEETVDKILILVALEWVGKIVDSLHGQYEGNLGNSYLVKKVDGKTQLFVSDPSFDDYGNRMEDELRELSTEKITPKLAQRLLIDIVYGWPDDDKLTPDELHSLEIYYPEDPTYHYNWLERMRNDINRSGKLLNIIACLTGTIMMERH